MISEPSSTQRLFIIQIGIWHMPSSAENSSTPQYVLIPICEFEIMKVMGYWMRSLASSCKALVGRITISQQSRLAFSSLSWNKEDSVDRKQIYAYSYCLYWFRVCRWMQDCKLSNSAGRRWLGWRFLSQHCSSRIILRDHRGLLDRHHRFQINLTTIINQQLLVINNISLVCLFSCVDRTYHFFSLQIIDIIN